jgi:hypothetical protein
VGGRVAVRSGISGTKTILRQSAWALGILLAACAALTGCEDYYSTTFTQGPANNSSLISVNPAGTIPVDVGKNIEITALVSGDTSGEGVTWSLQGAGTLTNVTTAEATYNAPATGVGTVLYLTATSVATPTEFFTSTIELTGFPSFVTTSMPGGTEGATYDNLVTVTGGAAPFSWSIVSGSLPPGLSFSVGSLNSLEILGTPTTVGTYNFTVQATDSTGGSAKQALSIVISAAGSSNAIRARLLTNPVVKGLVSDSSNNAMLNGQYAFLFNGKNNGATVAAAGSFAADGAGNITGGIADRNEPAGPQTALGFTGTYNVGANHLGMMFLDFADGTSAAYAIAANSQGGARFIEFDDLTGTGTRGAGEIATQDASAFSMAKLAGNYAFALNGTNDTPNELAMMGSVSATETGALKQGQVAVGVAQPIANGTVAGSFTVDAIGRGTAQMNVTGINGFDPGTMNMNFYVVSADEWFGLETDAAGHPLVAGVLQRETAVPTLSTGATQTLNLDSQRDIELAVSAKCAVTPDMLGNCATARMVSAPTTGVNTSSFAAIFAGARSMVRDFDVSQVLLSIAFDGNGNLVLQGVKSDLDGLSLIQQQTGAYTVSGGTMTLRGVAVDGMSLSGTIASPAKISLLQQGEGSNSIIVEK